MSSLTSAALLVTLSQDSGMLKNMRSATSNLSHENQAGQDRSLSKACSDQPVQQQLQCQRAEHHPIEVSDTNRVRHVLGDRKGYFQSPGHEVLLRLWPCSYAGTHTITAHFKEATVAHLIVACHSEPAAFQKINAATSRYAALVAFNLATCNQINGSTLQQQLGFTCHSGGAADEQGQPAPTSTSHIRDKNNVCRTEMVHLHPASH